MIPQDPIILYSYINTLLRDQYPSLKELCKAIGVEENEIIQKLRTALWHRYNGATVSAGCWVIVTKVISQMRWHHSYRASSRKTGMILSVM